MLVYLLARFSTVRVTHELINWVQGIISRVVRVGGKWWGMLLIVKILARHDDFRSVRFFS